MKDKARIAIIGGGIAGASAALYFGSLGVNVTLFEKNSSLVSGPPMCHLHAGGNLYREISDEACITLLEQSIDLARFYPDAIDYRPTLLTTPLSDKTPPSAMLPRLKKLKKHYLQLIQKDENNKILGDAYYKVYSKKDVQELLQKEPLQNPQNLDEWLINALKTIDIAQVQYPLIMVEEYGLNMFRISALLELALTKLPNVSLQLNCEVKNIHKNKHTYTIEGTNYDYLINAAGFQTGTIDDALHIKTQRMVEFKAAYVTKWRSDTLLPEIIFHGERGTPNGMAQFTPYPDGFYQLHGMRKDVTLFDNGLVKNTPLSAQPQLTKKYIQKISSGWSEACIETRTKSAINYMSNFIPSFKDAEVAAQPLYGAQQIPGEDATLRTADVAFEGRHYARCEIVKASSILDMIDAITKKFISLNYLDTNIYKTRALKILSAFSPKEIQKKAEEIAQKRGYPKALAHINISKKHSFI